MDSDKQLHMDIDTIVSFVIQSGQVSEGGPISMLIVLMKESVYHKNLNSVSNLCDKTA